MRFSVITPNLNGGRFLEGCIKSVLAQDCDVEHIVVDGKSEDESLEIVDKYRHVTLISELDCGMYDAINKGILRATGDPVAYLNADDRYISGALKVVETECARHSRADYFFGGCTYVDNRESAIETYMPPPLPAALFRKIHRVWWAQPSTFWRRTTFEKAGLFNARLKYCGDYEFVKRCINLRMKGVRIQHVLSYFMVHDHSLGGRYSDRMAAEYESVKRDLGETGGRIGELSLELYFKAYNLPQYVRRFRKWKCR